MRAMCWTAVVTCSLVFTGALRADDQTDPKAFVAKAVKAMGGEAKLAKFSSAGTVKCKLTHEANGQQGTIDGAGAWQGPDKIRFGGDLSFGGESGKILLVINGDEGWAQKNDQVREAPAGMVPALKKAFYAVRMPHLLPGLKDKAYTLGIRGEEKVDGKAVMGITVSHKDRPDVTLFFDQQTSLLVKCETRITDPNNREIVVEFFFSDFKDVSGIKHPMKITFKADDSEFGIEISEIQPQDKVDDSEFAKP